MIRITHRLVTDLSITLGAGEFAYIQIHGYLATCLLSLELSEIGGTVAIQSTITSTELFENGGQTEVHEDLLWENIRIRGVEYSTIDFEIPSLKFNSPNILYVKNISPDNQKIRFSLRGNR